MKQTIIPFILYAIIQCIILFIGFNFIKKEKEFKISSILQAYVIGHMSVFAVIEILSVPMILLRLRFDILYWSFIIIITILFVLGLRSFLTKEKYSFPDIKDFLKSHSPISIIIFIMAITVIAFQFWKYFKGMHLDEDDARWLAEANDALEFGDMMTRNYSTGDYQGAFTLAKDVTSPWPMMWAILARTLHINAATAVHTIYASFELLVIYVLYYLIARELFEKKDSRFTFLLSVATINMFFAGTTFTQSAFSMVRIWQGKATVAAVVIPLLIYLFICINKRDELRDWIALPIVCCGACLMSGMGISLSAFMILIYGLYNVVAYRHWKRMPILILAVSPSVILSFIYFFFKG